MGLGQNKIIWAILLTSICLSLTTNRIKSETISLPGSDKKYTPEQINDSFNAPDWYPDDHPPLPEVVAYGSKPAVFACASCHLTSGSGHPESAYLSGLPADYLYRQLKAYQQFQRPSLAGVMINIARHMTDEQMKEAAFSDEKVQSYIAGKEPKKVIVVPKKLVNIVI